MWPFSRTLLKPVTFFNTLSGTTETFTALKKGEVRMYSCGPTVYGPQHIGNLRAAVFSDTVARTLASAGYRIRRVINITDVGHMVGDGDQGEDKITVGATREGLTPKEVATRYAKQYLDDIRALNIDTRTIRFPRATDYIQDQIQMIERLEKRGHTYTLPDGVYFDTSTFSEYGKLGARYKAKLQAGARVEMVAGKKHPEDFVLWRMAKPNDLQKWKSPWGEGNPGWSIECSAMIYALLGRTIDIHTGGEDHVSIHHNNEIAQSECANSAPLARYWLHNAFLTVGGEKISKSLGNTYVLDDVKKQGVNGTHPLALRYFFLQAHYRSPLAFSWEALNGAHEALKKLWRMSYELRNISPAKTSSNLSIYPLDDLRTPQMLAELWKILNDDLVDQSEKRRALMDADEVLGLSLLTPPLEFLPLHIEEIPQSIQAIAKKREVARENKDFKEADALRIHIKERGYLVEDTPTGPLFTKSAK